MSWPRQGSQNPLDNRECKWKTWISWVWGFGVVHAVKGSFEVALPPNASVILFSLCPNQVSLILATHLT